MRRTLFLGVPLAVLFAGSLLAEEALKSGPQPGEKVPGAFNPLHVNGEDAGKKVCLVCKNGPNPVAMVFAREVSEPLTRLLKKLDQATAQHSDSNMGSFVVFCSDDEGLNDKLHKLAEKEKLQKLVLSIDNPTGPAKYRVAKDADVTVVLYNRSEVKVNHAFKKGELKDKDIDTIVQELAQILPAK